MSIADLVAGGGIVHIPAGTYDECLVNNIPSGTTLIAQGGPVWIRPSSGDCCIWLSQNQHDIECDGINLDGTNTWNGALKIEGHANGNPHHFTIRNAEIIGNLGKHSATVLFVGIVPGIIGHNRIINCQVHGGGVTDLDHTIYISSSDNLVEDTECWDFCGAGVQFYNGYGIAQSGNVLRNTVIRDGRTGVMDPQGRPGRHTGIWAYSQNGMRIEGCTVTNIPNNGGGTYGVEISADNVVIDACTITGVQGCGVTCTSGSGNVVKNSDLRGNDQATSGNLTLENNLTEGAPDGGTGPVDPPPSGLVASPDGTTIPPAPSIVDPSLAVWTFGGPDPEEPGGQTILKNGTDTTGAGVELLLYGGAIYTLGTDAQYWTHDGANWVVHGPDPRPHGELPEGPQTGPPTVG